VAATKGQAVAISRREPRIGALDGADLVRERRTTQELVFEFLRDAILSGRLRGGSHLVQDKIATELKVSRVPVREALLQLESEGLVRMEAHRGASVVWLSPDDIQEIFEIRSILVTAAIRRVVPNLSDSQIERVGQITARKVGRGPDTRNRLKHEMYAVLFESLDRPRLHRMIDKLAAEVDRYLTLIPDRPHVGEREMMEPLRRRDAEGVAQVMEAHLETVSERVVARVRELVADGHLGLETTGRRRRASAPRRAGRPTLLGAQPLAG
jgi:DNA-binding GntR family transcriptional regulator